MIVTRANIPQKKRENLFASALQGIRLGQELTNAIQAPQLQEQERLANIQKQEEAQASSDRLNALASLAASGDQAAIRQLSVVAPKLSKSLLDVREFEQMASDSRHKDLSKKVVEGAAFALASDNPVGFLINRRDQLRSQGIDSFQTDQAIRAFQEEGDEAGREMLRGVVTVGEKLGIIEGASPEKLTTLEKNLVAGGLERGSPEFKQAVLENIFKPTNVTKVSVGSDTAEQKAIGAVRGKQFERIIKSADAADQQLSTIRQIENIDVETGSLEPLKLGVAKIANAFGINASGISDVANAEALNALTTRMVNDVLNSASGPQTDQDAERARKAIRGLSDSQKGGQFKISMLKSIALRNSERRDFIESRLDEGDNLSRATKAWREFAKKNPVVSSKTGDDGLPVLFHQYEEGLKERNPEITRGEALRAWRDFNNRKKSPNNINKPQKQEKTSTNRGNSFIVDGFKVEVL